MIEESSVLIVGNDKHGLAPERAIQHCIHHLADEVLSVCNIGRWSIVIAGGDIYEVGVDK